MRVGIALTLLCAGAGCAVGRRAVADTAEQPPGGAVSGTAVPGGRDGSAPEPRVLATANDVDALFSLFVAGTTVYYTGGRAVPVPADAAPGSDVSGIVRSISRDGQSPAGLWSGQGYALAIAVTGDSAYFLTDDYGSEGRAGQLHRLSLTDGSASVVRGWSAQGSSVGIAGQGTFVAWSYTSGSGGEVLSTTGADTTLVSDSTDPARGQIAVSSAGQVFWLSTPKSLFSASPAGALQSWTLGADVRALALNDKGDRVFVATAGGLVAITPATGAQEVLLPQVGYVTSLKYWSGCLYWSSSPDWSSHFQGSVYAMSEHGGPVATLASAQGYPQSLFVDAVGAYWVNRDARQIAVVPTSAASTACQLP